MAPVLPLIAAAAAIHTFDVPDPLGHKVQRAKESSQIAVLLPQTIRSEFRKLFPDVLADPGSYTLFLGAARNCSGGGACGFASFSGRQGGKPRGAKKVKLAKGRRGRFTGVRCGANCSHPTVQWKQDGNVYEIESAGFTKRSQRRGVVRLANSAIRNGPR